MYIHWKRWHGSSNHRRSQTRIYATQNRRLVDAKISDDEIRHIRQESYIEPIVSLLAIGVALIAPWVWTATLYVGFLLAYSIYFALKRSPKVGATAPSPEQISN